MKDYIKYIVTNESLYRRIVFFLILIFSILMFILISIIIRKKPLHQVEGIVDLIEKTEVSRKNNSTFDLQQNYHLEEVIDIEINERSYFIEVNFRSKWNYALNNVHVGDSIVIYYIITEEGSRVCQLEKKSKIILDYKELLKIEFYIKLGIMILSILIFAYVLLLFSMRKKHLKF